MNKAVDTLNKWLDLISLLMIGAMVVLVWAQVFMRYVLNFSPFWIEAVARYLMIWALLLSASVLVRKDEHVRMDVLIQMLSPRANRVIATILSLAILSFLIVYTLFGFEAALDNLDVRDGSIMISMFWPLLILPFSGLVMLVNLALLMYEVIFCKRSDS